MAEWPACGGGGSGNAGSIIVPFTGTGGATAFDSAATFPEGSRVWVDVEITTDFDGDAVIFVGVPSLPILFADSSASDIDPTEIELYHIPQTTEAPAEVARVTIGGTPTQGEGYVIFYWTIPEV